MSDFIYESSRGMKRGKYLPRTLGAEAIVIHTTGRGPHRRMARAPGKFATPFEAALHIYQKLMDAGPHIVVGQGKDEIAQLADYDVCAWHVGGKGSRPYRRKDWATHVKERHAWWVKRWAGLMSPRDLAGGRLWLPYYQPPTLSKAALVSRWQKGSCNANSYGIEVVPPLDPAAPWSRWAWESVIKAVKILSSRDSIPLTRSRVITHSDAHPLSRTTPSGKPWDETPRRFTWEEFALRAHVPA